MSAPSLVDLVVTPLGWVGAIAAVTAYAMVTRGRWSGDSLRFQLTNFVGASLMCLVAAVNGVWPSAVANVVWIVIGGQAIVVLVRARRRRSAPAVVVPLDAPGPARAVDLAA
ncbi:CBU_0592 family membrane protein [Oerskovia turbata]